METASILTPYSPNLIARLMACIGQFNRQLITESQLSQMLLIDLKLSGFADQFMPGWTGGCKSILVRSQYYMTTPVETVRLTFILE